MSDPHLRDVNWGSSGGEAGPSPASVSGQGGETKPWAAWGGVGEGWGQVGPGPGLRMLLPTPQPHAGLPPAHPL